MARTTKPPRVRGAQGCERIRELPPNDASGLDPFLDPLSQNQRDLVGRQRNAEEGEDYSTSETKTCENAAYTEPEFGKK